MMAALKRIGSSFGAAILIAAALYPIEALARVREADFPAAAVLPQLGPQGFMNCKITTLAHSSQPVELMSFCGHAAMDAARVQIAAWFLSLDVMQLADWRPARLLLERLLKAE